MSLQTDIKSGIEAVTVKPADVSVAVKDTNLLYDADYARAGDDLLLSGPDGPQLRILDYFGADTPPALVSADGAVIRGDTVQLLAGPLAPGQYAQAGDQAAGNKIGEVKKLDGSATVQRADGTTVELKLGSPIFKGDVIETGQGATAGIVFNDDTVFLVKAGTRIVVNEFVYNPGASSNSAVFDIVKGTFSFVAGKVAPSGGMKITTPVATMGIRGTAGNGLQVASENGRLGITQDPDGTVSNIFITHPFTGDLITIMNNIGFKIVQVNGTPTLLPKTAAENAADAAFTGELHGFYNSVGIPRSGLLDKTDLTGSPDFQTPSGNLILLPQGLLTATLLKATKLGLDLPQSPDDNQQFANQQQPTGLGAPTAGITSDTLDEDGVKGANDDTPTALEDDFGGAASVSGNLIYDFGPDGPSTADMDIQFDAASLNGQYTSKGEAVIWVWNDTTNTLTGFVDTGAVGGVLDAGDRVVLTLEVTDVATGAYTATLEGPFDHAGNDNEDALVIALDFTVKDATGDTATGQHELTIGDDVPVQNDGAMSMGTVEEEHLAGGNEDITANPDLDDDTGGDPNLTTAVATGSLAALVSFGLDGPGSFNLKSEADVQAALDPLGLKSGGATMTSTAIR
jgi:hypothetical protein